MKSEYFKKMTDLMAVVEHLLMENQVVSFQIESVDSQFREIGIIWKLNWEILKP